MHPKQYLAYRTLTEEVAATASADTGLPTAVFDGHLEGDVLSTLLSLKGLWAEGAHLELLEFPHEVVIAHPTIEKGVSSKSTFRFFRY